MGDHVSGQTYDRLGSAVSEISASSPGSSLNVKLLPKDGVCEAGSSSEQLVENENNRFCFSMLEVSAFGKPNGNILRDNDYYHIEKHWASR